MVFSNPAYEWLFIPMLAVLVLAIRNRSRMDDCRQHLADPHLLPHLVPPENPVLSRMRLYLPFLIMLLLTTTLMRPQWGTTGEQQTTTGLDIVVALDVSKSMLADDLSPTRLSVATRGIEQLLGELRGDRIGIVAFAGSAFQVTPLTSDYAIVREMITELGTDTIPKGGSSIASALLEAERSLRGTRHGGRVVILVSDGEDHDGKVGAAVANLKNKGITIFAVRSGTADGGVIPLSQGQFVRDRQGMVVKSRASVATLSEIDPSAITLDESGNRMTEVLTRARALCTEQTRTDSRQRFEERFQIPLAAALLLWVGDLFLQGRRKER